MTYILNTKTGRLHEKPCADGETPNVAVDLGDRQPYPSIENAKKDPKFKACHINRYCISENEC